MKNELSGAQRIIVTIMVPTLVLGPWYLCTRVAMYVLTGGERTSYRFVDWFFGGILGALGAALALLILAGLLSGAMALLIWIGEGFENDLKRKLSENERRLAENEAKLAKLAAGAEPARLSIVKDESKEGALSVAKGS